MKSRLLLFSLLLSLSSANAQFTYFSNLYNNDYFSGGLNILEIEPGYLVSGVSGVVSNDYIFKRIVLTAIDYKGNQLWWKTYGEDFHNYYVAFSRGFIETADNGYFMCGTIEDSIRSTGLLIKFNHNGDSLWSKVFGDTVSTDYSATGLQVCIQLPYAGYLISGSMYVSGDDGDIIVIRTDSIGNTIWQRTYGVLHWIECGWSITQLPEGKFLIGIERQNINIFNSMDPGLLKIDSLGNLLWIRYYGSYYDDSGAATALSQDGNYLIGSAFGTAEPDPGGPLSKVWIFKTDTSGNMIWERKYNNTVFVGGCLTIDELEDGSIITSGLGGFEDFYGYQGWIIKTKQNGDSIWMRRYNYLPEGDNYLYDISFTPDNGIIFTGMVFGPPDWEQSIWVQKLDSIGCDSVRCDTTVGIAEERGGWEAGERGRMIVYPNPAREQVHVRWNMDVRPTEGLQSFGQDGRFYRDLRLEIYDIFGREMLTNVSPSPVVGEGWGGGWGRLDGTWNVNVSSYPPGVYIAILKKGLSVQDSRKFIIAR
jgi:hypothetical protein